MYECVLMRIKDESIDELFDRALIIANILERMHNKRPKFKFGYSQDGLSIIWITVWIEE